MAARDLTNLGLRAFYNPGDNGWGEAMSLNMLKLSLLTQAGCIGVLAILPSVPVEGDVVILDEDNVGHANQIAMYDNAAWIYVTPLEGWWVYDRLLNHYVSFNGAAWVEFAGGGGGGASALEDLTDVDLSTLPTDGQVLAYNEITEKWEAADGGSGGGGGSGALITSTKWRMRMLNYRSAGNQANGLATLEFLDASDAVVPVVTPIASATEGGYGESAAFDNNPATAWYAPGGHNNNEWIGGEFAAAFQPRSIRVVASSGYPAGTPQDWALDYFDGIAWINACMFYFTLFATDVDQTVEVPEIRAGAGGGSGGGDGGEEPTPIGEHRYWSLRNIQRSPGQAGIKVQMADWSLGGVRTVPVAAAANAQYDGSYGAANAIYPGAGNPWADGGAAPPGWIYFDFGTPHSFDQLTIKGAADQNPGSWTICYSDDLAIWTPVQDYSGFGWVGGVLQGFVIPTEVPIPVPNMHDGLQYAPPAASLFPNFAGGLTLENSEGAGLLMSAAPAGDSKLYGVHDFAGNQDVIVRVRTDSIENYNGLGICLLNNPGVTTAYMYLFWNDAFRVEMNSSAGGNESVVVGVPEIFLRIKYNVTTGDIVHYISKTGKFWRQLWTFNQMGLNKVGLLLLCRNNTYSSTGQVLFYSDTQNPAPLPVL